MHATDRVRRVVTVLLVAAVLLVAPQVAYAGFSTPQTSSLQVGAAALTAPSSPVETHVCPVRGGGNSEDFAVTLASFTGPSPTQLSYTYTYRLLRDGVEVATATSTSRTTVLTYSLKSNKFGAYALSIEGRSGNWVSPALVVALPCLL